MRDSHSLVRSDAPGPSTIPLQRRGPKGSFEKEGPISKMVKVQIGLRNMVRQKEEARKTLVSAGL